MSDSNWIHLDVDEVLQETDKALLLRLDNGEEVWIPLSQISDPDNYQVGDCNCTISVTQWIANEKGL